MKRRDDNLENIIWRIAALRLRGMFASLARVKKANLLAKVSVRLGHRIQELSSPCIERRYRGF